MQKTLALEYNSQREQITIPEYGRHIQKLIEFAKTQEDKQKRQETVEQIIALILQMNPQNNNVEEYVERLWKHVYRISNYELDVTAPGGITMAKAEEAETIAPLHYPQNEYNHRHYGNNVQVLIDKAIKVEDEEKRQEFTGVIAAYMKLAYRTWNKEHFVNDEIIKADIERMSGGKLTLTDEFNISNLNYRSKNRNNRKSNNRPKSRHTGGKRQRKR